MRTVAVLCAARNSVYHEMEGVDVFDALRGARSFAGGMPVIAHPPCRAWSAYCAHQAKPAPGEKELGIWCAEQVRENGGVLEQPAHSRLFDAAKLPKPVHLDERRVDRRAGIPDAVLIIKSEGVPVQAMTFGPETFQHFDEHGRFVV